MTSKMIIFAAQAEPPRIVNKLVCGTLAANAHLYKDVDDINSVFTSQVLGFLEPGADCTG